MAKSFEQILQIAKRSISVAQHHEDKIEILEHYWSNLEQHAGDFVDFVPIRLVTIIEAQVRSVVAQAIDTGDLTGILDRAD